VADDVVLEWRGDIAVVSNNRPEKLNATSDAFNRQLWECFYAIHVRPGVRAVVWRGEGKAFSSGRDLAQLGGARDGGMSHLQHIERGHGWTQMLLTCPAPIVVAMKGWAIGGMFERALLCDLRVGGRSARFWLPEAHHGVVPDSGGLARLFQIAGHGVAADMALTARVMDAEEAYRHGILSRLVDDEAVDDTAFEMAEAIAKAPAFTVKLIRRDLAHLGHQLVKSSIEEEALLQAQVYASDDYAEMKAAKAEGRPPVYRGR
jgi:enoyl-CoA hydratase/carnithine racemase